MRDYRKQLHTSWDLPFVGTVIVRKVGSQSTFAYYQVGQGQEMKNRYLGPCDTQGFPREKYKSKRYRI